jgi:hypothetical protein
LEVVVSRKKLALAGFEQGEGPWIRARGTESHVSTSQLKEGEILCLEVEGSIGGLHLHTGTCIVQLHEGQMYRFTKKVPEGQRPSKTCVEVIFNV